jgi:hypothetical protein
MTPAAFRRALRDLGLSQAEAARRLGMAPSAVNMMARGTRPIERRTVLVLKCWIWHQPIEDAGRGASARATDPHGGAAEVR